MYKIDIYHGGYGNCPTKYVKLHIQWCKDNINGYWNPIAPHTISINNGREIHLNYEFWFEEEIDAMAFKLRWL